MPDRRADADPKAVGHRNRRIGMVVFVLALLAIPAGITGWNALKSAEQAPDFEFTTTGLAPGEEGPQTMRLSDLEGETVLIDFMAYNCASCRFVTPKLEALYEEYANATDVTFLTIDVGEFSNFPGSNVENLAKWQTEEYDSPWLHALDTEGIFLDYVQKCLGGIPCLFILDADRQFVFQNTGIPDRDELDEIIAQSRAGEAMEVSFVSVGVVGLAAIAGIASFFAPCSVGLIPAYMGFLIQGTQGKQRDQVMAHAMKGGLLTALGIVLIYAVLALILWVAADALAPVIPKLGIITGSILIALGVLMLFKFDWEKVAKLFGMGKVDGRKGFFAFGIGYGLAAFGCTGPIFLPVLLAGFLTGGAALGFAAFLVYALAVAAFVMFAAYLVAAGQQSRLRGLLSHTQTITRIAAVLMILGGAYLVWFDFTAFGAVE